MKRTIIPFLLVAIVMTLLGAGEKEFGKKLTLKQRTKISDIMEQPEKYDGKRVLVEGPITDVCKKRGCWISIGSDKEFQTLTFKVEDGVIVFPVEVKGSTALVEGIVEVKKLSVEEQIKQGEHLAEEQGKTFDPSTVKGPKVSVRILGEGAVVR